MDKAGFVETDDTMKTKVDGIYVAGDMVAKKVRQVTTAVNDGTIAGMEVVKYILKNRKTNKKRFVTKMCSTSIFLSFFAFSPSLL